jgi:hypothetical protein
MRLDVVVKCIRFYFLNFLDDCFNSKGMGVCLLKFFFWMCVELPMYSHPADTPPRGLGTGQAGTIAACTDEVNTKACT